MGTRPHGQRGPLNAGFVVVKPDDTLYVAEGTFIFDRPTAKEILRAVGGKIDDAAYYA